MHTTLVRSHACPQKPGNTIRRPEAIRPRRPFLWAAAAAVLAAVPAGCGGEAEGERELPEVVPVSGKVLYDGEPVKEALVTFHPQGPGDPATGNTEANGRFVLTTYEDKDGAVPGTHVVTVELFPEGALPGMETETSEATSIPEKYSDPSTSPLSEQVNPDGTNDFTLELED